jgi:hypothetical protein
MFTCQVTRWLRLLQLPILHCSLPHIHAFTGLEAAMTPSCLRPQALDDFAACCESLSISIWLGGVCKVQAGEGQQRHEAGSAVASNAAAWKMERQGQ